MPNLHKTQIDKGYSFLGLFRGADRGKQQQKMTIQKKIAFYEEVGKSDKLKAKHGQSSTQNFTSSQKKSPIF